ncbi:MAG TPA: DUF222 domain-containing protein [Trebonia sp.]|nr:DUF222 domain-containing protein [Trebonia sp.]
MDWQPGQEDGEGTGSDRDPGPPPPGSGRPEAGRRDPRLAMFARDPSSDDSWAPPTPSGRLALLLDELSGPDRRCPGATADERIGLLQAWAAFESYAASGKLGVIRDIMRAEGPPSPGSDHGDLPETWSRSLRYELAGALACSTQSAESIACLAWDLGARLPRIAAQLDKGAITSPKAKAIVETFSQLTDPDAAAAEAMIADQLEGKTYTQIMRLAEQAALTVDPGLAERWRKHAQKNDARVTFFREQAGTAGLSGRDLPPDEALAAMATVNARAEQYKESDAFDDTPMDVLRARAYLDLINGIPAATRIALAEQQDDTADAAQARADPQPQSGPAAEAGDDLVDPDPEAGAISNDCPCAECDGSCVHPDDDEDPGPEDDDGPDGPDGPDGRDAPTPQPGGPSTGQARERRPADLVVPLRTLLGLSERPGELHGFGLLDPALARQLAAAAVASSRTEVCVTVTSPEGYAIGHGCARPIRKSPRVGPAATPVPLPARLNLTIPAAALPALSGNTGPWSLTPHGSPESKNDSSTWTVLLPGGRELAVRIDPVPVFGCDHRDETHHYQPSDRLRHLVQIRDGTCTFPPCNRHARESDFEHCLPYDKGGKTCACNAGARSRACHQVKQSPGWNVAQPKPGWHRWETPAGRVYTQEPKRYPA